MKVLTSEQAIEKMMQGKVVSEIFDGHFTHTWKMISGKTHYWYTGQVEYEQDFYSGRSVPVWYSEKNPYWKEGKFPVNEQYHVAEDPEDD